MSAHFVSVSGELFEIDGSPLGEARYELNNSSDLQHDLSNVGDPTIVGQVDLNSDQKERMWELYVEGKPLDLILRKEDGVCIKVSLATPYGEIVSAEQCDCP
jgi:hypothetical protein